MLEQGRDWGQAKRFYINADYQAFFFQRLFFNAPFLDAFLDDFLVQKKVQWLASDDGYRLSHRKKSMNLSPAGTARPSARSKGEGAHAGGVVRQRFLGVVEWLLVLSSLEMER